MKAKKGIVMKPIIRSRHAEPTALSRLLKMMVNSTAPKLVPAPM